MDKYEYNKKIFAVLLRHTYSIYTYTLTLHIRLCIYTHKHTHIQYMYIQIKTLAHTVVMHLSPESRLVKWGLYLLTAL